MCVSEYYDMLWRDIIVPHSSTPSIPLYIHDHYSIFYLGFLPAPAHYNMSTVGFCVWLSLSCHATGPFPPSTICPHYLNLLRPIKTTHTHLINFNKDRNPINADLISCFHYLLYYLVLCWFYFPVGS